MSGPVLSSGREVTFAIVVSQLPRGATRLVFKTIETFEDGTSIRWVNVAGPGQPAPTNPAPVLLLMPAATGDVAGSCAVACTGAPQENTSQTAAGLAGQPSRADTGLPRTSRIGLQLLAVVAVLAMVGFGVFVVVVVRRPASATDNAPIHYDEAPK
ncbi:DUF1775 domain-containing protein [Dactylosporangium sucinum]|uniref:DUF1775 domain-containing protein n=1 Tax=Dactylosporangium sucinum TaxID=1424081 RepID=UPI00167E88E0|nr:DUF1775 domain-containing protein [Dactylosporangium sucinum]